MEGVRETEGDSVKEAKLRKSRRGTFILRVFMMSLLDNNSVI